MEETSIADGQARNTTKISTQLTLERPKSRWKDDVENDIMGFVMWRQVAQNRDGWRKESGEALILLG